MSDLIDRQAAIDIVDFECGEWVGLARTIRQGIEHLPPAQPEIVRCKYCKFWREHKYAKGTKRYIPFCGLNAIYTNSDDFCSKAERRTDEKKS